MGQGYEIFCPHCGYRTEVYGVGGQCGMMGYVNVTVTCPKNKCLVDTDAGNVMEGTVEYLDDGVTYRPGRCPKRNCRSRTHQIWDLGTAICPVCGEPECETELQIMWD